MCFFRWTGGKKGERPYDESSYFSVLGFLAFRALSESNTEVGAILLAGS